MQTPATDALLGNIARTEFDSVVVLYDRFAHSNDPFDPGADKAEETFNFTVQLWFDNLPMGHGISFQNFRKQVIVRCKRQIISESKSQ